MSNIQKVEIVQPVHKGLPKVEAWAQILVSLLFMLPLKTLFVFWFVASWFPEWGLTFWELILPVYIAGSLFRPLSNFRGRWIPVNRLFKLRHNHGENMVTEEMYESKKPMHKEIYN